MKAFPWRTALFVSLALNVLLIGAIVGWRLESMSAREPEPPARGAFMASLSPDERAELRRMLRAAFFQTRNERIAARRERAAVMDLATAETYDAAAVREALRRMRAADAVLLARVDDAVVAALADLPPEQRRAAVEALARERAAAARRALNRRWRESRPDQETPAP